MKLCNTVNEFFLAHVGFFSFARGAAWQKLAECVLAKSVSCRAKPLFIGIAG